MPEPNCAECKLRAKYDNNPKSLMGRLWRWHINFCPGWKAYMLSLTENDRISVAQKYGQKKFM